MRHPDFHKPLKEDLWFLKETRRPEAVFMESYQQELEKVLRLLTTLLHDVGVRFCVIGGAARNAHGAFAVTEDIDLLVDQEDSGKLDDLPIGFIRRTSRKRLRMHDANVPIELIFSGEKSGDGVRGLTYPPPETIAEEIGGVPYIDLYDLIRFKLTAGMYSNSERSKDFGHVSDVIRARSLPRDLLDNDPDLKAEVIEKYHSIHDRTFIVDPIDED